MPKQPRVLRDQRKIIGHFDIVNRNAAGIDAGSEGQTEATLPDDAHGILLSLLGTLCAE